MSKCISREGEYSDHEPGDERFYCGRCYVFDEDAVLAALTAAESRLARVEAAVDRHPACDRYEEGESPSCGWKSAFVDVRWALGLTDEGSGS